MTELQDEVVHAVDHGKANVHGPGLSTRCGLEIVRDSVQRWVENWPEQVTCPACKQQETAAAADKLSGVSTRPRRK